MVFLRIEKIAKEFKLNKKIEIDEFILNGKFISWKGITSDVISPICLKGDKGDLKQVVIGHFPLMDDKTVLKVLDESFESFGRGEGAWPKMSVDERITYLEKFILALRNRREDIIKVLMWEIAKSLKDASSEFDRTVSYILESIEVLKKKSVNYFQNISGMIVKVKKVSRGVVFVMGPYNYPLNETFTMIIPALLMGNTVIVKPPRRGGLIYKYVLEAIGRSFPKGVFNVVFGRGIDVVEPIMKSGKIDVFAFIGSHLTANKITKMHPKLNRLKLVFGLDAKNIGIVLEDCDLEKTVSECLAGSLSYNGQRCTALKLLYVEQSIYNIFLEKFSKGVDSLVCGLPFENPDLTPIPPERLEFLNSLVEDGVLKGARIINSPKNNLGNFFFPKILSPVNKSMKIFKEEQFGPIIPIIPFKNLSEPKETIFESNFGQQCSIFGKNPEKIGKLIDFLSTQVSRININSQCQRGPDNLPFGGRKDSAVEILSISNSLEVFSIPAIVTVKTINENKDIVNSILQNNYSNFLENNNKE